jgi:hypothetical protein
MQSRPESVERNEREDTYRIKLTEIVLSYSREDSLREGQYKVVDDFSKFWAKLEDERLKSMLPKQKIQVEEAIKSFIDIQIKKII